MAAAGVATGATFGEVAGGEHEQARDGIAVAGSPGIERGSVGSDDLGTACMVERQAARMGLVQGPIGERARHDHERRLGLEAVEETRIDRWLWAVRLCKTRAAATDACKGGHVQVNGRAAKPSTPVRVGDRVEALLGKRQRVVEVAKVIEKRVGAPVAAECLVDHSPPPPPKEAGPLDLGHEPGSGRPTKRDRRQLDRFRGR